jgi:hypothetical protein
MGSFVVINSVNMCAINSTRSSTAQCSYLMGSDFGVSASAFARFVDEGDSCFGAELTVGEVMVLEIGPGDARRLLGDSGVDAVLPAGFGGACDGVVAVFAAAGDDVLATCGRGDGGGPSVELRAGPAAELGPPVYPT